MKKFSSEVANDMMSLLQSTLGEIGSTSSDLLFRFTLIEKGPPTDTLV